jgi:hypothetical protein
MLRILLLMTLIALSGAIDAAGIADIRVLLVDDDDDAPDVSGDYENGLKKLGISSYSYWETLELGEPRAEILDEYDLIIWVSGDARPTAGPGLSGQAGPSESGETALATYLEAGGCLFLVSQDYYAARGGVTPFMSEYLGVQSVDDDGFASGDLFVGDAPEPGRLYPRGRGVNFFADVGPSGDKPPGDLFGYPVAGVYFNRGDYVTPNSDGISRVALSGELVEFSVDLETTVKEFGTIGISRDAGHYSTAYLAFPAEPIPQEYTLGVMVERCVDLDFDTVSNGSDNCPTVANPDQKDRNGDGVGDACSHQGLPAGVLNLLLEE